MPEGVRRFTFVDRPRFLIGGRAYIPTNEIVLSDGKVRVYAFTPGTNGYIRSFVTSDGQTWDTDPAVRLALDTAAGLEQDFVKDATVIRLTDSTYLMAYCTIIPDTGVTTPSVTDAFTYDPGKISPGSIVSIFGTNLDGPVTIDGRRAPVFYASPVRSTRKSPGRPSPGLSQLAVGSTAVTLVTVRLATPAIFPGFVGNEDGTRNTPATGAPAPTALLAQATSSPFTASLGDIEYLGLTPGSVGLAKANVRLAALAAGEYSLSLKIGAAQSNAVTISVGPR